MDVEPGTVVVYTDVGCPWSTIALHRFYRARSKLCLDGKVHIEHRLFLLEDAGDAPTSRTTIDAEMPVLGPLHPELGFALWHGGDDAWPSSTLLANEAVHAARLQSPQAAETLDMELRLAFFRDSRCISLLHEIVAIAKDCAGVDAGELQQALEDGRARGQMMADYRAHRDEVKLSPHFFLPDGTDMPNPGMQLHMEGEPAYPVIDSDDPSVYESLVRAGSGVGDG
ncbi:MAG TPA: DsbA family protein [Actinomycetales bacterium]|nr:DsbA family protein [Actinomycetales bacterium]